jgi:hypothetical protein
MVTEIMVGVRLDGSLDIDFSDDNDNKPDWTFNNITIEQAEFLLEELTHAMARAKLRAQKLAIASRAEVSKAEALKAVEDTKK